MGLCPLLPSPVCMEYPFLLVSISLSLGMICSEHLRLVSYLVTVIPEGGVVVCLCTSFLYLIAAVGSIFLRIVGNPQAGVE